MALRFSTWALALSFVVIFGLFGAGQAQAQDRVWVQIEAHPDLGTAQTRVRAYSQLVDRVNGFQTPGGLYTVALGPYTPDTALIVLQQLLGQGLIPSDSYIENGTIYASQFFPVGADTLQGDAPLAPAPEEEPDPVAEADPLAEPAPVAEADPAPEEAPAPEEPVEVVQLEETPQQARQSEAQLTREERDQLQIALQWFGFYNGRIDGAFGPGTRGSMQAYQTDRGMEPSGILTTRQRAQLLGEYQAELDVLGMENVIDQRAGIQMDLPMAMVQFDSYNFPFGQYEEINDSGVRVLLISQPGDRATLFGLYEIMQTLDIVPLNGERERGRDIFVLSGQSASLRSHTEARLVNGAVKGFTLIWEPSADDQMARVLPMMQSSFSTIAGALDPAAVPEGLDESIDMVSGLTVRSPDIVRTGFYLDAQGTVLTTTEVLGQCDQILLDNVYETTVAFRDDALGVAVLRPVTALAPLSFARMAENPARLRADVAVAGYPFGGALSAASTSFGMLADLRGVNGEDTVQRLDVATTDTEAGGPVLDVMGNVIGMVLPGTVGNRTLPEEVTLALRADRLIDTLQGAGVGVTLAQTSGAMNRENISRAAADISVRVSCWN